jgi:cytochrome P450
MSFELFNPLSPEHQADPFLAFGELAHRGALHRTRSGLWLISGHALAADILRNKEFRTDYSTALARTYGSDYLAHAALRSLSTCFVLHAEKADGELRKHFAKALSSAQSQAHTAEIRELAKSILSETTTKPQIDLLHDFAIPFTLQVLCLLLRIPRTLAEGVPTISSGLLKALDCARLSKRELHELDQGTMQTCEKIVTFLKSPAAEKSECIGGLLEIARRHGLSLESVSTDLLFIFLAGFETTSSLVAQVGEFLWRHPDVADLVARESKTIPSVVEEFARLHPAIHIVTRRPRDDVAVSGQLFPKGSTILVLIGAANRDPVVFPDPGKFVIGRPKAAALTFGAGAHSCIGAALARHELAIAFESLAAEPRLLGEYRASWRRTGVFRSLASMEFLLTQDRAGMHCTDG